MVSYFIQVVATDKANLEGGLDKKVMVKWKAQIWLEIGLAENILDVCLLRFVFIHFHNEESNKV